MSSYPTWTGFAPDPEETLGGDPRGALAFLLDLTIGMATPILSALGDVYETGDPRALLGLVGALWAPLTLAGLTVLAARCLGQIFVVIYCPYTWGRIFFAGLVAYEALRDVLTDLRLLVTTGVDHARARKRVLVAPLRALLTLLLAGLGALWALTYRALPGLAGAFANSALLLAQTGSGAATVAAGWAAVGLVVAVAGLALPPLLLLGTLARYGPPRQAGTADLPELRRAEFSRAWGALERGLSGVTPATQAQVTTWRRLRRAAALGFGALALSEWVAQGHRAGMALWHTRAAWGDLAGADVWPHAAVPVGLVVVAAIRVLTFSLPPAALAYRLVGGPN